MFLYLTLSQELHNSCFWTWHFLRNYIIHVSELDTLSWLCVLDYVIHVFDPDTFSWYVFVNMIRVYDYVIRVYVCIFSWYRGILLTWDRVCVSWACLLGFASMFESEFGWIVFVYVFTGYRVYMYRLFKFKFVILASFFWRINILD